MCARVCAFMFASMHACTQVCNSVRVRTRAHVHVCGTPLSRHICLALISFAWHRDQPVSLVFNKSLDSGHLSRSEYSFRIMHSFSQNHFKVIMFFLFSEAGCKQVVYPACCGPLKTHSLCCDNFGSLSVPFFHLLSISSVLIVLLCHVSDSNF